ncbi:MAG: VCBS repeat-containing protein, partial [Candidatus Sumerlaeia bacterium]|nr:VCBS repeat-containing protein [Candidatus Sumerlaeia bacterium]
NGNISNVFLSDWPAPAYDIKFADFDNDSDYDIYQSNTRARNRLYLNIDSDDFVVNSVPDNDRIGDGVYVDISLTHLPNYPSASPREFSRKVAVGDVNGDGRLDIVVANGETNSGAPNVLLLNLPGPGLNQFYFADMTDTNLPLTTYANNSQGPYMDDTYDVALADFDGDGDLDIFFANNGPRGNAGPNFFSSCRLLLNNGNGIFVEADDRIPTIIANCQGIAVADFDHDGEPTEDINGNGILDPDEDINHNGILDWEDRNGNGRFDPDYDIFITVANGQNILLINDGNGRFTDETFMRLPLVYNESYGCDVGDVDLDGDLDIVVANYAAWNERFVQLLLNNGSGIFTDVSNWEIPNPHAFRIHGGFPGGYNVDNNARDVDLLDLDRDGDLDMFVSMVGEFGSQSEPGWPNFLFLNRRIGANWNARNIITVRTPGNPIIRTITPKQAVRGTKNLEVTIVGSNFKPGLAIYFGQGINVVSQPELTLSSVIKVKVNIAENAIPGGRQVTIVNPDNSIGRSRPDAFIISMTDIPYPILQTSPAWTLYE